MKISVIGGGSTYTPELMEGFIELSSEIYPIDLYLMDINEERLEVVSNFLVRMARKSKANINIKTTTYLEQAIEDADFVINQIRVGGQRARLLDETIPLEFNLLGQETTGVGGFANALRTIPVALNIAKKIEELSPSAWLINFANPSGIITEAISKYTKAKVLGLCNVAINFQNQFARLFGVSMDDVFMDYFGLNHLTFVRRIYVKGKDRTEEAFKKIKENLFEEERKVLDYLNMFPNHYLRYYYFREEKVMEMKSKPKRAEEVMKIEEDLLKLYRDANLDEKPKELEKRGGALYSKSAVNLIFHLLGLRKGFQIVNIVNEGAIFDLPHNVVVEIPVYIEGERIQRYVIGNLPKEVRGIIQAVKTYEELTIESAVEGSFKKALWALAQHPLISSLSLAEKVLKRLIEENKDYFPKLS
ncbi:MAG: 6-phospho-beta-glucosidase [Dictyoglomus sp. NZ13-RE01]|nr:MAG: 6-phospho-beta-glucosidase [Dictyoglomus sp. NZ13-RE01]